MYGGVDRGGGREGKKKSLRNNKIQIDQKVKALQKGHVPASNEPEVSAHPPPVQSTGHAAAAVVDCGVQLINRQFDRDQLKVLQRASGCGVQALIAWTSDFEKVDSLVRLAKENTGFIYYMVGVHSDMIKRNNDKLSAQRMEQLREAALRPEAVAVMAGLDFSRDIGIRYAQERTLQQQMELAVQVALPLVLYQVAASDALVEKIQEFRDQHARPPSTSVPAGPPAAPGAPPAHLVAVYGFSGSEAVLSTLVQTLGCFIMVNGRVADPAGPGQALRAALLGACPPSRLLVCSDAPYATPQNIEDAFVREGRNEPSNLPYITRALASTYGLPEGVMAAQLRENAFGFFGLQAEHSAAAGDEGVRAGDKNGGSVEACREGGGSGEVASGEAREGREEEEAEEEREGEDGSEGEGVQSRSGAGAGAGSGGRLAGAGADGEEEGEEEQGGGDAPSGGASRAAGGGAGASASHGQQRRQIPQHEAPSVKKQTARSFLPGTAELPRITYACRGCRSVLMSELDVRVHHTGAGAASGGADAGEGEAGTGAGEFKRSGRAAKSKGQTPRGQGGQLCSLYFLQAPMPWMQLPDAAAAAPESNTSGGARSSEESRPQGQGQGQEGRLDCPCCGAKVGRYSLAAEGIACSCGAELSAPAVGLLRARLDLLDGGLDLARAVQSSLKQYEEAEEEGRQLGSSESDDGQHGDRKKKKKQVKGRGNTSNFSSFRNKTFGQSNKTKAKGPNSATAPGEQQEEHD